MYSFRDLFDTMPSIPPGKGHLPQARSVLGWGAARCDLLDVPPTPLQMTQASDRLSLPASSSAVCVPPSLSLSPCHVLSSSSCSHWVSAVFLSLVLSLFLCLIIFLSFSIFSLPPKLCVSFCLCISPCLSPSFLHPLPPGPPSESPSLSRVVEFFSLAHVFHFLLSPYLYVSVTLTL